MNNTPRHDCLLVLLLLIGFILAGSHAANVALADGWHNASLSTGSLDEWLNDLKRSVPEVTDRLDNATLRSGQGAEALKELAEKATQQNNPAAGETPQGGKIQANYTDQQLALMGRKANDCLEIMAYMDKKNIIPREFPRFNLTQIPKYRANAKSLLNAMGPVGSSAVVEKVRSHLMGRLPTNNRGLSPHPSYYAELIEVLKKSAAQGDLSAADFRTLLEASQGAKSPEAAALAAKLNEVFAEVDIPTLLNWINLEQDPRTVAQLKEYVGARVKSASTEELLAALHYEDLPANVRVKVANELTKDLPELSVVDLLAIMNSQVEALLRRSAAVELQKRRPAYSEVQSQILEIQSFTQSEQEIVARFAQWHLVNAFQRAPVLHCLYWLGQGNESLNKIIWKQLEARIARADADRRASYFQVATAVVKHKGAKLESKIAALQLFAKLNDQQAVEVILDQLSLMPRELWPHAGESLATLTGQDFGPQKGDGVAEVSVAIKRWRQWFNANK